MKKSILYILLFFLPGFLFAQDEEEEPKKKIWQKDYYSQHRPVRPGFPGSNVIDGQTVLVPSKGTMEFMIQHRFGSMKNGISDLWGIYGTANTRLGLAYSITDWLQVGYGITKFNMVSDFSARVAIFRQTRDNKVPLDVVLYGNMGIEGRNESHYGKNYTFANRFSYFSELMVARKFTDWLMIQVGASFTHFNAVPLGQEHDKIGLHFVGRARFSPQSAFIISYDWPLIVDGIAENKPITDPPKPSFGFGYEVSTSTHVFQVFFGTTTMLVPQYVMMYNQNEWYNGDFFIGFNINRLWSF